MRAYFIVFTIDVSPVCNIVIHPFLPAALGSIGLNANNARMIARTTPAAQPVRKAAEPLFNAAKERVNKLAPDKSHMGIQIQSNVPAKGETWVNHLKNTNPFAGHMREVNADTGEHYASKIFINPNASREYFAHELGHHVSDQTKIGHAVRSLRNNPKLALALGAAGSMTGAPLLYSALQEGDDDMAESVALSIAASAPTLVDEALATKNGLAIMKDAGLPATIGQRGRLAGGYLSYTAPALLGAVGGNLIGNLADDELTALLGYGG